MSIYYLYIHIPFCLRKCLYCDFFSVPFDQSISEEYIDALIGEITLRGDKLRYLKTVYVGGGTPTVLQVKDLERLFKRLMDIPWSEDIEVTIEANPATIDRKKIRSLKEMGVNRFSLGIQSFIDRELETLCRIHNSIDAMQSLELLRKEGIKNISVDLIYGIPEQSLTDWEYNLSRVIRFSPEHISTYELTPEEGTPLKDMITEGRLRRPEDNRILDMYYHTIERLTVAGYRHYEISNFAKDGYQCRHNLNYWDRGEYIGLGAGAHSFEDGVRRENLRDVRGYIERIKEGLISFEGEVVITEEEALKEYLFLGLRKREGLSTTVLKDLKEKYGVDIISAASTLIKDGLLEVMDGYLRLTETGITVSNSVIVGIFENLGL